MMPIGIGIAFGVLAVLVGLVSVSSSEGVFVSDLVRNRSLL